MRKSSVGISVLLPVLTLIVLALCIAVGSIAIPLPTVAEVLWRAVTGQPQLQGTYSAIILSSRLPRVLCMAL